MATDILRALRSAECNAGMFLTCASKRIEGLDYIVKDDAKCTIALPKGQGTAKIPACARIGGFIINAR